MRRTATTSVSLFPFLAVLLCAMGALIVLLVILTNKIRDDAIHNAQHQSPASQIESPPLPVSPSPPPTIIITRPAPPVEAPIDPNIELRATLAALQAQRGELQSQLTAQLDEINAQQSRRDALTQTAKAARLARDADEQRLMARLAEIEEQRRQIQVLESEIADSATALESAEQALATAAPKLQIVPYDGRSGTARKPILIECTAESIRFVPEDIALTPADIEGFRPSFNPLLAGAAALRNYWAVNDDSSNSRPYILLLVHEDGIIAYYAARSLLESLGADTGYELITDGQKIAFPELDPAAREVCRDAVREALELRSAAEFSLARREQTFRNGLFDVDPREHDPTLPDIDDGGLYPVRPPSNDSARIDSRNNSPRSFQPLQSSSIANAFPDGTSHQRQGRSDDPRRSGRADQRPPSIEFLPRDIESSQPSPREQSRMGHGGPPQSFPPRSSKALAQSDIGNFGPSRGLDAPKKKHWGQSSPRAVISLEHPVAITVTKDVIQVAGQPALLIGPDGLTDIIIKDVFRAMSLEAATWDAPPEEFYWTPHVKAAVEPGAEFTFTRLRSALEQAGLRVTDHLELNHNETRGNIIKPQRHEGHEDLR